MKVISSKPVVTRKPHRCWGCTNQFPIGSSLHRVVSVDMGKALSSYWCKKCQAIVDSDSNAADGYLFGELSDVEA